MPISRRSFLKFTGGLVFTGFGFDVTPALLQARPVRVQQINEARTLCPYCSVSCGVIAHLLGGSVRHGPSTVIERIEGDPDHPISQGALCSKGVSLNDLVHDPKRLLKPLLRARLGTPGRSGWREVSWDFALDALARRIKETRDANFIARDENDRTVNRLESIGFLGGAADTNEMNYLAAKAMRAWGLVYMEQPGRLGQAASAAALEATVGLAGMMTTWVDLRNSDLILVMGGNPAENQPVGFHWALQARVRRGARLVCVDVRMTRTGALADWFVPIRAGSDLALLGGLIYYALKNNLYHAEYVRLYTNASFVVNSDFYFDEGLFSGYDAGQSRYDDSTWAFATGSEGRAVIDPTLKHPRSVFQLLRRHYSRYTPAVVSKLTGLSTEAFERLAALVCATGRADRAGAILYAAGWAQHSNGAQTIRAAAILQLLLGNIGRSGGGLNALHGHANTQGSSDHGLASQALPGRLYLPQADQSTLQEYVDAYSAFANTASAPDGWGAYSSYFISLLTAWYGRGEGAPELGYSYLPKLGSSADLSDLWEAMARGNVDGLLVFGANPLASMPNTSRALRGLSRLKWLAVVDCFETETAQFWRAPDVDAAAVDTEVFLLPAAIFAEKEGSVTNACRWAQWRSQVADPPGEARSDLSILASLFTRVKELYAAEGGAYPDPILRLNWPYEVPGDPQPEEVAREVNGVALVPLSRISDLAEVAAGTRLTSPRQLRADGATACGNWLYCGSYPETGNLMARRAGDDPTGLGLYPEWAWASPGDQRILFNRAGVNRTGIPWDSLRAHMAWNGRRWIGDSPDSGRSLPPEQNPGPFTRLTEGLAQLYAPTLLDGPFPEHYEPLESPVPNILHDAVASNPLTRPARPEPDKYGKASNYPIVCTTYRLAEHFHWWTPHLRASREWQPDFFVELPEGLAQSLGVRSGDAVRVISARGQLEGRALVTKRIPPLMVMGRRVWQIGMPIHWGFAGRLSGPLVNRLTPAHTDPNAGVPEFKAFLTRVEKI